MTDQLALRIEDPKEDSDTLVIEANRPVSFGTPIYATTSEEAGSNPIARALVETGLLEAVLLQGQTITLLKSLDGPPWKPVLEKCQQVIEEAIATLDASTADQREMTEDERGLALQIQELLNLEINPMVATHGGFIEVLAVNDASLYVHMGGGCQGCAMSTATLKQGVEAVVFGKFPQIESVLDTTDHAAGTNPYYKP